MLLSGAIFVPSQTVELTQTARHADGTTDLLKSMTPLALEPMASLPADKTLSVDTSVTFQEIVGFGGAFTEASAINWRLLSKDEQAEVIRMYFADPADGGHGYTIGRVPINSCDFSPASYSFDDTPGDVELKDFDDSVAHDVDVGMIPMIQQATDAVASRGLKLNMYASPWSPPAWMKLPGGSGNRSMVESASPNGLDPKYQRPWAEYFSRFISAYKAHGIDMWGVTVQNEPEAAVGWEAMLWTPQFQAQFVKNHLGPVLRAEQPGVKIIGFDHNKDHVYTWAKVLYADPAAAQYFDGIGVHWYGGLNTHNLNATHHLAPDKFILPTEACNCGGVVFRPKQSALSTKLGQRLLGEWWSRAESLALDILEDLRFWAVGWTDWNLVLSPKGGPNHLKNLCDANIIADPDETKGLGRLIVQSSYYYMGHFSRFVPPGSRRIALKNLVETKAPPLAPGDVKNGQALVFTPCDGNAVQKWSLDESGGLVVKGTDVAPESDGYKHGGECADAATDSPVPKVQVWGCAHSANQQWEARPVKDGSGHQLYSAGTDSCLTAVRVSGSQVGLDPGTTVTAAQFFPCEASKSDAQTFALANYDAGGFPSSFPVRTSSGLCLQPSITRIPHFDAVAFQTPDGGVSLVAINIGEEALDFALHDAQAGAGVPHVTLPAHAIHTYRWKAGAATATMVAQQSTAEVLTAAVQGSAHDAPQQPSAGGAAAASAAGATVASATTEGGSASSLVMPVGLMLASLVVVGAVLHGRSEQRHEWLARQRQELLQEHEALAMDDTPYEAFDTGAAAR